MALGLGLDVGGTKILACVTNERGELLAEERHDSPESRAELLGALTQSCRAGIAACKDFDGPLVGIGIGMPGLVDADGVLHAAPNLPAAAGLTLRAALVPTLEALVAEAGCGGEAPLRVVIDNDATCAAAGELAFGAARSCAEALVVTLGTGIGGGVVAGGRLLRGSAGFAGEIGHMVVVANGPACACGSHGCWEQFASGTGLARMARAAIEEGRGKALLVRAEGRMENVRSELVMDVARAHDDEALALVETFASFLALGLSNLAEILDPESIVLGGGLISAVDVFFAPLCRAFASTRRGSGDFAVRLEIAQLNERAGALGAAALALGVVS